MQFVKVTIRRGGSGEPKMKYPAPYNAEEVDRVGIGPGGINQADIVYSGDMSRGSSTATCLIMLPPKEAAAYTVSGDMEIISDADVDTLMEENRLKNKIPEETVNDINRIQSIQAKTGVGITVTAEDLKSLDVDDRSVPGVVKSRRTAAEIRSDLGE